MPENTSTRLSAHDLEALAQKGIDSTEAQWQLELLREPPGATRLIRPATVGDGIERLAAEQQAFLESKFLAHPLSAIKFVPASGAASRMFKALLTLWAARQRGDATADGEAGRRLLDGADQWPFPAWPRDAAKDELDQALHHVLSQESLALPDLPKGLLPFHRRPGGASTAFEDQLREGALHLPAVGNTFRFHFTVSPQHEKGFRAELDAILPRLVADTGHDFEVVFSHQSPATDTLALSSGGDLIRDGDGQLLLRPGGHGALLTNLDALDAECIFVKNIDNIQPEDRQHEVARWKRILGGRLVELRERLYEVGNRLEAALATEDEVALEAACAAARSVIEGEFGVTDEPRPAQHLRQLATTLLDRIDRPLRVCGVVPNTGEPGGGPFWTNPEDPSLQIVEAAEIHEDQSELLAAGSHFNPVDLVLCTRDRKGNRFDLSEFVDRSRVFIAEKSVDGSSLRALERPGLWNGSMAHWNTVFVEVPISTFAPVKTLFDLLKPEHQPATD